MLLNEPSERPSARAVDAVGSGTRAEPRRSLIPFSRSLLPSGSPFGWSARSKAIYVQFLTALLMAIITAVFALLDGWPFLLEPPESGDALRKTTSLAASALVFWVSFYLWTWRRPTPRNSGFSWLLFGAVAAHIVTGTAVCYAIGPYTAGSGLINVAALLLGMVLLRRTWLWFAVIGWLLSMLAVHFLSEAGVLPFLELFEASLVPSDLSLVSAERAVAAALIYIPLAIVMDHLISVWRQDEQNLFDAAQFDALTGAYSRGFAVAMMQRALLRATEEDRSLAVLMVDLDHFKRINDAYGHAHGDLVLQETTLAIQGTLRSDDIVCRFGGEEFVVLLPGADLHQAMGAAERCRAAVESMEIPGAEYLSVTASVGVAAFPDHGDELDVLLTASDQAMYAAKAQGRNRIASAR